MDLSDGPPRWWTVYFCWPGGGGYRYVFADSKRRAAWAVKFHPGAFGVESPTGEVRISAVTRYVGGRRPEPRRVAQPALVSFERHFSRREPGPYEMPGPESGAEAREMMMRLGRVAPCMGRPRA